MAELGQDFAQVVGETLEALKNQQGGLLHQEDIVRAAKPKRSVLHKYFEWDDKIAGHRFRLEQAEKLIHAIVIVPDDDEEEIRAFVSIPSKRGQGGSFTSIEDAMSTADWRQSLLETALRELEAFQKRYERLSEFAALFAEIKRTAKKVKKKKK